MLASVRADSLEVAEAAARVDEAAAAVRAARAPLFPSLDAEFDVFAQSTNSRSLGSVSGVFLDAELAAAYEFDFWGKNNALIGAARAEFGARRYDKVAASLSVAAAVAATYFEILGLRDRIGIAKANVAAATRMLEVVEARVRAGVALTREQAQQRGLVAQEQAKVEHLRRQEMADRAALGLLLGGTVSEDAVKGEDFAALRTPDVTRGVPSDLLSRRPDLARIEAELVARRANVDAARAAMLPRVRLTASAGLQSVIASTNVTGSALLYVVMASVTQPIFDGGALGARRDQAIAERQEWLVRYRRAVLAATTEVQKALQDLSLMEEELASLQLVAHEAETASRLAETEYRGGAGDLLAVLDTQRTLAQANNALSELRLARLLGLVSLFKSVGGGWEERTVP